MILRPASHCCFAVAALVIAALLAGACADDPRSRATLRTDLSKGVATPALRVPLAPIPLATQADFDALEEGFLDRRRTSELVTLYEQLAQGADPAARAADALLLQRLAILLLDDRSIRDGVNRGLGLAEQLHAVDPPSAHGQYLNGYAKRKLLTGGAASRMMMVTVANRPAAQQVITHWERSLALDAAYAGPNGHTSAQIREDLARLKSALAATPAANPVAAPAEPAAAADEGGRVAIAHLARFETSRDAERKTLCRERRDTQLLGGPSLAERRVDLVCDTFEGRAEDAVTRLEQLVAQGASLDLCARLTAIARSAPPTDAVTARLNTLGLGDCAAD